MTAILRWCVYVGVVLAIVSGTAGHVCSEPSLKGDVIIFHAGSLTVPLAKMEKEFEAKYPGVDVKREAGGSTKMARMISELGKPADIMASADYMVINKSLIPNLPHGTYVLPLISWSSVTRLRVSSPTKSTRTTGTRYWARRVSNGGIQTRTSTHAAIVASWF